MAETTGLAAPVITRTNTEVAPLEEMPSGINTPCANASSLPFPPGSTQFAWTDMPILFFDPPPVVEVASLPQKCLATITKKKFWENIRFRVGETDEGGAEASILSLEPEEIEMMDFPLKRRMQEICQ